MFTLQRVLSAGSTTSDNLYLNNVQVGTFGHDSEGAYLNLQQELTMGEMNLLIAQLINQNPSLLQSKLDVTIK